MLAQDLFEAAPSNMGQDTLRQLQTIASSGQNADLKIGMEMMPIQSWQATYLMGVYKGIRQKYGVEKALSMLGNYDFVNHALARQEQKLSNMSRVSSIPGERDVVEGPAVDAYMAGKSPAIAHYANQLDRIASNTQGVAEGLVKGEYGRVLDALQLYYPRLSMEELNVPGYHKVVADKANVPVEYAARVINDFARDNDPDEDEFGDFNDDEQGVAEGGNAFMPGIENTPEYKSGFATGKLPVPHPEGTQQYVNYYKGVIDKATPNLNKAGMKEGAMPASVIQAKERIRLMSDAEKREYFKGKTKEELVAMARRHGYGAGSNVYAKYATEKNNVDEGSSENTGGENRTQLKKKLKELEAQLDPSFEFSDDHRYWKQQHELSQNIAAIKRKLAQNLDEEIRLPYPEGSEKLGLANMSILIKAYNEPKSSRTTLSFGNKSIDLDREDVAAIADYYDDKLPSNDARWNFVRAVMNNYDNFIAMLHQIGRRSASSTRQPGLFQEADKKKDDEDLGTVKDVVLQRAITRAKADFPTAGSGLEALAQDFMRSQEQDKKEFAAIRSAEREQDQLLGQISKIDQEQQQDIGDLENQNSAMSQRLQQLQNVNSELEKKLSAMTDRRTQRKAVQPAAATSTAAGTSLVSTRPKQAAQNPAKVKTQKSKSTTPVIRRPQPSPAISSVASQLAGMDSSMAQLPAPDGEEVLLPTFKRTANPELTRGRETATDTEFKEKPPAMATTETKRKTSEPNEVDYDDPRWDAMVNRVGQLAKSGPLKTVWDPEKRVYRVVPVSQLKKSMKEQEHDRREFEEIKTVSDWAERLRVAKELQKDVKLMTDPEARVAVKKRINELMKYGLEKGYYK